MSDAPSPKPLEVESPAVAEIARINAYVAIWTKAVDTQMHFNEMSAKSRQLGLTFVAASLGVSIVLLGRREDFSLQLPFSEISLHISVLIFLATALAVYAVSILDLNVYHRMLRGAVTFGEDFEENYLKKVIKLDKGMTQAISHYSRVDDATVRKEGLRYVYGGHSSVGSAQNKIRKFYNFVIIGLIVAGISTFATTCKWTVHSNQSKDGIPTINSDQTKVSVSSSVVKLDKPDAKFIEQKSSPTAPLAPNANK